MDWFFAALGVFLFGKSFGWFCCGVSKAFGQGAAAGRCFDRYGPRLLLVAGATIYVSSMVMISWCKSYYQYLLTQGTLFGLGVGLM